MARILPYEMSFVITNIQILSICERSNSNKISVERKIHGFVQSYRCLGRNLFERLCHLASIKVSSGIWLLLTSHLCVAPRKLINVVERLVT